MRASAIWESWIWSWVGLESASHITAQASESRLAMTGSSMSSGSSPRTRAILPVHFAGLPCDLRAIRAVARKRGLVVIEDAAHAVGAFYEGTRVGGGGALASFSFYANKNMTTAEGGMVTTDDDRLAEAISLLRLHGLSTDAWAISTT